jgi:hypothetical protein
VVGAPLNALSAAIVFGLAEWLIPDAGRRIFTGGRRIFTGVTGAVVALPPARADPRVVAAGGRRRRGAELAGREAPVRGRADRVARRHGLVAGDDVRRAGPALEDAGARRAARRSVEIFRKRWGEGIAGSVSVGFVTLVAVVPGTFLVVAGLGVGSTAGVVAVVLGGALLLGGASVANALSELFALAVYRFEVQGAGSFGFEPGQLDGFVDLKRTGPRR